MTAPCATLLLAVALGAGASPGPADGCAEALPAAAAWCAELAARPALPGATASDRAALRAIFERPEFRRARADVAGLRRRLLGMWQRLMELLGTAEAERYASVGRMAFLLAGVAAGAAALASLRRRRRAQRAPTIPAEPAAIALPPPPDRSASLAAEAFARGDLAGAIRHAFLSALGSLEEAGRLPRDRTLTNRELALRLSPPDAPLSEELGTLGRLVDAVVYGGATPDPDRTRHGLEAAARIRALARGAR
jgi:hypothetical protein